MSLRSYATIIFEENRTRMVDDPDPGTELVPMAGCPSPYQVQDDRCPRQVITIWAEPKSLNDLGVGLFSTERLVAADEICESKAQLERWGLFCSIQGKARSLM